MGDRITTIRCGNPRLVAAVCSQGFNRVLGNGLVTVNRIAGSWQVASETSS